MNYGPMMKQALYALEEELKRVGRDVNSEAIAGIIETHAVATAASAAASAIIPGTGGTIAFGIACASTITMYGRLAKEMGITLSQGLIRAVVSALAVDLGASVTTSIAATAALSFIPGLGSMAASTITAITNFAFVYLAGMMFVKLIAKFGISRVQNMSQSEMKSAIHDVQKGVNMTSAMKEARSSYKTNK